MLLPLQGALRKHDQNQPALFGLVCIFRDAQ